MIVREAVDAIEARQAAAGAAARARLGEVLAARVSIIASEMASNLVKHTSAGGEVLINTFVPPEGEGSVELLALDRGPGMSNPAAAFEDGYTTAGSIGAGLGGMRRQATHFELHSSRGKGTAVLARVGGAGAPGHGRRFEIGVVTVPKDGEEVSGDGWAVRELDGQTQFLMVDGLGHGLLAMDAAILAVETFRKRPKQPPAEIMRAIHEPLRATRGATVGVASIAAGAHRISYAGIGNIAVAVVRPEGVRWLVSMNGTVGRDPVNVKEFESEWAGDALLVAHSDGLSSRWRIDEPGLFAKDPALIAAVLYRDHHRELDDVTVMVARPAPRAAA